MLIQAKRLFLIIILFSDSIFSQTWERIYFPTISSIPYSLIETYDFGFLIGGSFINYNGTYRAGYIIKTNINGVPLWFKTIGQSDDGSMVATINATGDGGCIIGGSTIKTDPWSDPFIMKLNSCGESEWCRIYNQMHDTGDYTASIFHIQGGYIAFIDRLGYLYANDHIKLLRLDENGNLLWQQIYYPTDSLTSGGEAYKMILTPDYKFLLSGDCYYPDSGTMTPKYLRPYLIKIDSSGSLDWELPWSKLNGQAFDGQSFKSILDNNNVIYSCGRHIVTSGTLQGDKATLLKTDRYGSEMAYYDLNDSSIIAIASTINWLADSTIAIGGGWKIQGEPIIEGVFKTDTQGNILKIKELFQSSYTFTDAIKTTDNKIILIAGLNSSIWQSYAWKLNSDLEYDSIYTGQLTYDSLCPHLIVSDTIPLDCEVVGIDELIKNELLMKLLIYPNPARNKIHIDFPHFLKKESQTSLFNVITYYYQWNSTVLNVYDVNGKLVYSNNVSAATVNFEINVSNWTSGLYYFTLLYNNQNVSGVKVIIQH
jgi:hypothetical protein